MLPPGRPTRIAEAKRGGRSASRRCSVKRAGVRGGGRGFERRKGGLDHGLCPAHGGTVFLDRSTPWFACTPREAGPQTGGENRRNLAEFQTPPFPHSPSFRQAPPPRRAQPRASATESGWGRGGWGWRDSAWLFEKQLAKACKVNAAVRRGESGVGPSRATLVLEPYLEHVVHCRVLRRSCRRRPTRVTIIDHD